MDTIKIRKNNAKMIAHRGLSGIETENTAAAFIAAGNRSYWGIECDVYRSADGKFVVFHDGSTGRLADRDCKIEETPYDILKDLTLYDTDGSGPRNHIRISTLNDYTSICKKYGKRCVIELKSAFAKRDIEKIINEIISFDYLDRVIFISFNLQNLLYARELLPEQAIQYLVGERKEDLIGILTGNRFDVDIHISFLNKEVINEFKTNNIAVNCWTCDDPERAEELVNMGVDMITTNILE